MGNAIVKGESEEPTTDHLSSAAAPIVPRKHSTVSTARLLLYGERLEYLTEDQKALIRFCWKKVEDDVARVGVITFIQ
jgi:hypothetical protein